MTQNINYLDILNTSLITNFISHEHLNDLFITQDKPYIDVETIARRLNLDIDNLIFENKHLQKNIMEDIKRNGGRLNFEYNPKRDRYTHNIWKIAHMIGEYIVTQPSFKFFNSTSTSDDYETDDDDPFRTFNINNQKDYKDLINLEANRIVPLLLMPTDLINIYKNDFAKKHNITPLMIYSNELTDNGFFCGNEFDKFMAYTMRTKLSFAERRIPHFNENESIFY